MPESRLSALNEREEFLTGLLLRAEAAEHAGCDGRRPGLLHAAHRHAQMSVAPSELTIARKGEVERT